MIFDRGKWERKGGRGEIDRVKNQDGIGATFY